MEKILLDLETALKGKDRNELFPSLGDAWVNLLAVENGLILAKRRILAFQWQAYSEVMPETRMQALRDLRKRVQQMEEDFDALPKNSVAYRTRMRSDEKRFDEVQREAFHVSRAMIDLRNELLAIDKFIKDMTYRQDEDGNAREIPEDLLREMQKEKARAMRVAVALDKIDKELHAEMARIGLGGDTYRSEEELKARMLSLYQTMEGQYPSDDEVSRRMKSLHERIWTDLERVAVIQDKIHEQLDRASSELLASVQEEMKMVKVYRKRLKKLDSSSRSVARKTGVKLFRDAKRRIGKAVLLADQGIIDLAWERRQYLTERVSALSQERSEKISKVQSMVEELMSGPSYKPMGEKGAAKSENKEEGQEGEEEGEGEGEEGEQDRDQRDLITPVMELRMLISAQRRVRARTARWNELGVLPEGKTGSKPGAGKAGRDQELREDQAKRLSEAQDALGGLTDDLIRKYPIIDQFLLGMDLNQLQGIVESLRPGREDSSEGSADEEPGRGESRLRRLLPRKKDPEAESAEGVEGEAKEQDGDE